MPQSSARSGPNGLDAEQAAIDEARTLQRCVERVAHDLCNPICAVRGHAYLLEREFGTRLGDCGRNHLAQLQEGIDRVGRLIEELLEASTARRRVQHCAWIGTGRVLRGLATELKPELERRGIELAVQEDPAAVFADPDRFSQVALNLLCNAVQHMGGAEGSRVEVLVEEGPACRTLVVCDNGCGIPADRNVGTLDLFRCDQGETGLGLPIVRRIMGAHGGTLEILSSPGEGTTAICRFPNP